MLNGMRAKNTTCEQEAKFIQDRLIGTERNVAELCYAFSAYSRKAARLRDKGDEIAKITLAYAESEEINKSLSDGLAHFANAISLISDYGDLRVKNIDQKVVAQFSTYEEICKHTKEEVKQIYAVRSKEIARKRQLDRARERNPRQRQQIMQAETEFVKASTEVAKTIYHLEEQVSTFEKQKLRDLRAILLTYIATEMGYHAKCLELLTKAYQDVNRIDEEADLEEFRKSLRMPDLPNVGSKRSLFRGSQSLGSLSSLFSTPKKKHPGIPTSVITKSKRVSRSEEILDSSNKRFSDSESVDSGSEEVSEEADEDNTDDNVSHFVARKYLK